MMTDAKAKRAMDEYRLLGRSGLRVSPLCLGTMTFGTETGWGSEKQQARTIFDQYLEVGGNFIDTADAYTTGTSEEWLGDFISETKSRDRVVLATKYTFGATKGDPNAGGNSRKAAYRCLEGSLRRLKTDYIDLYWLHAWDMLTPAEEVLSTLNDLVRQGKVRYVGLSDVPAWYGSRLQTMAELRGMERIVSFQLEYALTARNLEREHVPLAQELGIGICAWSPLAGGFLSGKYKKEASGLSGEGRVKQVQGSGNPVMEKWGSDRNWKTLEVLVAVAKEIGRTPAEVALNWVANQPSVTSTIIGARKLSQLESNLSAMDFEIPAPLAQRLEKVSRPEVTELDDFFGPAVQSLIRGGTRIRR